MPPRARRIDANQNKLVDQMRRLGMSVHITSALGKGFPDCAIGWKGQTHLLEIKDPAQYPSKRQLTDDEQRFFDGWKGSVHKVETIDDVLNIIK